MSMIHNIGTPPQESNCWSCNEFRFHNFADLTYRGYRTPNFECLGHRWIVILWPHGHSNQGTSVFFGVEVMMIRMPLVLMVSLSPMMTTMVMKI